MKKQILFLGIIALALGTWARPVSQAEARKAASVWAQTGMGSLGVAQRATALTTDAGATVYAAAFAGGTAFLSGDTARRPVILFVASTNDFSTAEKIDRASPLWALLNRDQAQAVAVQKAAAAGGATAGAAKIVLSAAEKEWAALLAGKEVAAPSKAESPSTTHVGNLDDVRAGPLVKSEWSQSTAKGKRCYNYYTPTLSDGTHAVCGCVATAMAQVMRYHKFPTAEIEPVTRECYVQASTKSQSAATKNLTTQGGTYDWDSMPLKPESGVTEDECKAIGKLTSDAGISVYMGYDTEENGGSGSFTFNIAPALTKVFGYANACYYNAKEISDEKTVVRNAMLSNFDAGYPVLMGISGTPGGHAIVGDGYGYKGTTLYVHLNMGWAGSCNAWYVLPDIDCSGMAFSVFDDLVYNIFPKSAGGKATLSGRVIDEEGEGVEGAPVTVLSADGEAVTTGKTGANGVYGVRVAPGTYTVQVTSLDGRVTETQEGVTVGETKTKTKTYNGVITTGWIKSYPNVPYVTVVGNLQNTEEVVLSAPTVRIGEKLYTTLDKALDAAPDFWAETGEPVLVELLFHTSLKSSHTNDFPIVLTSTNETPFTVQRGKGARLCIAEEGSVVVSNLAFSAASATLFEVAAGGKLTAGAGVDLGVDEEVAAVQTQDAAGFVLAGEPLDWFSVRCQNARAIGQIFGYVAAPDSETAKAWAAKFVNLDDPTGELSGAIDASTVVSPFAMVWAEQSPSLEDATAYYVVDGVPETTNCFRRLDRLFELLEQVDAPATVTVKKTAPLSRTVTPKADLTLTAQDGAMVSNLAASAGFAVTNGVTLTVEGLSFNDYTGNALFLVQGGRLELGGEMALCNIKGTNTYSGAVSVLAGEAVIGSPRGTVLFDTCLATLHQKGCGGAAYVKGKGCSLVFQESVTITNCAARSMGGAVYVGTRGNVALSGAIQMIGNFAKTDSATYPSDLCDGRATAKPVPTLTLAGPLAPESRIGVYTCSEAVATTGGVFMAVAPEIAGTEVVATAAKVFVNNKHATLEAVPNETASTLLWRGIDTSIKPVDIEEAVACIVGADGSRTGYASVEDAFEVLAGDGVIEVLKDAELTRPVTVVGAVTLKSGAGGPYVAARVAECAFSVGTNASLTVEGLTLDGRLDEERGADGTLLYVTDGGALTLGNGAVVQDVLGTNTVGAIKVLSASFTMLSGAKILDCSNPHVATSGHESLGGAVTVANLSTARLLGGEISGCSAERGGGVAIVTTSTLEIGGDFTITDNISTDETDNNLYVAGGSTLLLVSPLTGRVGYWPGVVANTNAFGSVAEGFVGTDAELADSAHHFTNDKTGDIGFAVRQTGGTKTLLVWSDGLDADGTYTDAAGTVYTALTGGAETPTVAMPIVAEGLVYNAAEQVGVEALRGSIAAGGSATDAGAYTATLTLKAGYVWADGETARVRTLDWAISPATLTVTASSVGKTEGYDDPELPYTVRGLQGEDDAASVLTGELVREAGEAVGTYAIRQGTLATTTTNYVIAFTEGTFTIVAAPEPPQPTPVPCEPFAFTAITQQADGSWLLTISPAVKYCTYTLQTSENLADWTPVGEGVKAEADGVLTFSVSAAEARRFWKALGADGEKPAEE